MNNISILVGDAHGIYVPQVFINNFDLSLWDNIDEDDIETIKSGPETEYYWDAWNNILESAEYKAHGKTFKLHQDGDLFAIAYDELSEEERKEFFGD